MTLCSKLKNGVSKIVTKSQAVTKFAVTKSRLHFINGLKDLNGAKKFWLFKSQFQNWVLNF